MQLIYQSVAGGDWDFVMRDCGVQPPYCTEIFNSDVPGYDGPNYQFGDCGSRWCSINARLYVQFIRAFLNTRTCDVA